MIVRLISSDSKSTVDVELAGITEEVYLQVSDLLGGEIERERQTYLGVAAAMETAVRLCPEANPADLWVHLIYNQFRTRFIRSDQSWKRVGGQAFEQVLLNIYRPRLEPYEINLRKSIPADAEYFGLRERGLGSAKTDLVLEGIHNKELHHFGVIHVKGSIAERLNDDTPASVALIQQGYWSSIATMDAKMFPPPHGDGVVRGELGKTKRGDKRGYFEIAGQFAGCYSFNLRTPPSKGDTPSGRRIHALSLSENQPDVLVRDIQDAWMTFRQKLS